MSSTGNEYEQPGVNYPDRGKAGTADDRRSEDESTQELPEPAEPGADHHGQDGGRDTLTASEAQSGDALGRGATQDLPAMSENNATAEEKIGGIVLQTRDDIGTEPVARIAEVLAQRLRDAGVEVSGAFVDELAVRVKAGAPAP